MIVLLPLALFLVGAVGVYFRGGSVRRLATIAMLVAAAGSLALLTSPRLGAAVLPGPVLAILLVPSREATHRLSFEALTSRVMTLVASVLVALFLATKFLIGENPARLSAVPWLLGAVGAAWLVSPVDAAERTQAKILLIASGALILLAAVPPGPLTAGLTGAMALVPAIVARFSLPLVSQRVVARLLLAVAGAVVVAALLIGTLPRPSIQDLALSLDGAALPAVAILLAAAALGAAAARSWIVVPGLLAVLAVAPSLRWAALAGLIAALTGGGDDRREERLGWLALLLLASTTLFAALVTQPWSPRAQIVGLAGTLVLIAVASRPSRGSALVLAATGLVVVQDAASANATLIGRFQWVTAAGAALLLLRSLLARRGEGPGWRIGEPLILGLLLLAAGAHDGLGLGNLAVVLLLVDLALNWSQRDVGATLTASSRLRWFHDLTGSGWPPTVRFAGVSLAVIAALQTSLAWGVLAAALAVALKVVPVIDRPRPSGEVRPEPLGRWVGPAVALACGVAPALMLRLLRG